MQKKYRNNYHFFERYRLILFFFAAQAILIKPGRASLQEEKK